MLYFNDKKLAARLMYNLMRNYNSECALFALPSSYSTSKPVRTVPVYLQSSASVPNSGLVSVEPKMLSLGDIGVTGVRRSARIARQKLKLAQAADRQASVEKPGDPLMKLKTKNYLLVERLDKLQCSLNVIQQQKLKFNCPNLTCVDYQFADEALNYENLLKLAINEFSDSLEVLNSYDSSSKNFEVKIAVNDRYIFHEQSMRGFIPAFNGALSQSMEFMDKVREHGSECLIPVDQKEDSCLLVSLLELHTGIPANEIPIRFCFEFETKTWSAVLTFGGVEANTKSLHASQAQAANELIIHLLLSSLNCFVV